VASLGQILEANMAVVRIRLLSVVDSREAHMISSVLKVRMHCMDLCVGAECDVA